MGQGAALDVAVIGGGLMGMALARRMAEADHRVTVIERDEQLGGLATWHDFGAFCWDRFYHVILPSDRHLIGFIDDIGLGTELRWQKTRTGFFVDDKMHSVSNNVEFLRFPLLNLIDKARLAVTMLYCARISDWQRLEAIGVEDWLLRVGGRRTYEKMWKPLLLAKLGENYRRVSAVFIWSYIKRLFSARDSSAGKEQLGHVSGGYRMVFDQLREIVEASGGRIETGQTVRQIRAAEGGGMLLDVEGESAPRHFDRVICTSPVSVLRRIAAPGLLDIQAGGSEVEYLGVVCVVLISRKPVVPYYVVNIADPSVPFTGIIGMSSVVATDYTAGRYMTYLPKYVLSTDEWLQKPDAEIRRDFMAGLSRVVPEFDPANVEDVVVNRASIVQPLQVLNFSRIVPRVETRHPDFFALNTAQFVNATLNNNEVIRAVDDFLDAHRPSLLGGSHSVNQ